MEESDGGVFINCAPGQAIKHGSLNFPAEDYPPNGLEKLPYVIVADKAFALHQHLTKPYPR